MTRLQKEQWAYLQDEARFIQFIASSIYTAIGGERQRSYAEQQRKFDAGLSKAKGGQGQHGKCKASDFEFFDEAGTWLKVPEKKEYPTIEDYDIAVEEHKAKIKPFGDHWESLDPKNFWGGNIRGLYDPGHFERRD